MGTLGGWSKRQKLTINHNKIDDELTDFPVKVIISSDNPIFDVAKNDGSDVRFTAADGETLLKFEREVHDTTEKIAVYHVKIPSVSSTSDTDFYLYYGNASASDASSPNDVWDSYYKLVMHMGPSLEDSTSNGNDGTNYGSTLGLASDGYYRIFDGVNDYITAGNSIPAYSEMTITTFISCENVSNFRAILTRNFGGGAQYGYRINTSAKLDGGICTEIEGFWVSSIGSFLTKTNYVITMKMSVSENNYKVFSNSTSIATDSLRSFSNDPITGLLNIGRDNRDEDYFNGTISEVRISFTARSDAWIKATSASLHDELLTFGDEEPAVTMMLAFNF